MSAVCLQLPQNTRITFMAKISANDVSITAKNLIALRQYVHAAEILCKAAIESQADWTLLNARWEELPQSIWLESEHICQSRLKALRGTRDPEGLMQFGQKASQKFGTPKIQVEYANGLLQFQKTQEAQLILEQILISTTEPSILGLANRFLAMISENQTHYQQALTLLNGRELGLTLLQYGTYLMGIGKNIESREYLHQALTYFPKDVFYQAWLHYNLGMTYLRLNSPLGEAHFLQAAQLAKQESAKTMRSCVQIGIAAGRRIRGEYLRALSAYQKAADIALDTEDFHAARWGIAHSYRLLHQTSLALAELHAVENPSWLEPELALTLLELQDCAGAKKALARAAKLSDQHQQRAAIAKAELARHHKDLNTALKHLESIPRDGLVALEESQRFRALFTIWDASTGYSASAQHIIKRNHIRLQQKPILRIWVNHQEIPLRYASKPSLLLSVLLEQGNGASYQTIQNALMPNSKKTLRSQSQLLSTWKQKLNNLLGWEAVRNIGGAITLDDQSDWELENNPKPAPQQIAAGSQPVN